MKAKGCTNNTYEEARKQRVEENKKRFEDLGISRISKNLTEITSSPKKTLRHLSKLKSKTSDVVEPRRSSRVRKSVPSYREDVGIDLPTLRKRSRSNSSSWGSYVARPLEEIKEATEEERICALEAAEALQINLQSSNPSFIKSMVRSHVYSCFWLGLPSKFCEEYLPKTVYDMILEDENGSEYEAVYIGTRSGLSGGWRAFALDHKLDDGDALVFELIEPAKFKIYIVRAFPNSVEEDGKDILEEEGNTLATKGSKAAGNRELENKTKKPKQAMIYETTESENSQEHLPESSIDNKVKPQGVNRTKKTKFSLKKIQKKSGSYKATKRGAQIETMKPKAKQCKRKKCESFATAESKGEAQTETVKPNAKECKRKKCRQPVATGESKGEAQIETVKPKATIKLSNKKRKLEEDTVSEIGVSGNTEQLPSENNLVKPRGAKPGKKNGFVQDANSELKQVESVEAARKCLSQKPRKKPAAKFFRKRA